MGTYLELGLLKANPFDILDAEGVGELVRSAPSAAGRRVRRSRSASAASTVATRRRSTSSRIGLDYVSCSPFRVPMARLAAAQAVLANGPSPAASEGASKKASKKAKAG